MNGTKRVLELKWRLLNTPKGWQSLIRVLLNGDDYGLNTSGTGDVVVRRA
jgi:hypothetical protein